MRETLLLAAYFFLPSEKGAGGKVSLVENLIQELGLIKASNTIIGNDKLRGVSGGERKRVSIATQLICDPAVLFLDEPTSGLDAFQAQSVMECMKALANAGRLVISVIHQPRSSIFSMFDKLLLLSEGHNIFYGNAAEAVQYFTALGYENPRMYNPADFFLDLLSPDHRTPEKDAETQSRILALANEWTNSGRLRSKTLSDINPQEKQNYNEIQPIGTDLTIQKTILNFALLSWRAFTESRRDYVTIRIKFFMSIFFGILLGGIFSETKDTQKALQNKEGFLFIVCLNQAFNAVLAVLNVFPKEKVIMNRYVPTYNHGISLSLSLTQYI